MKNTITFFFLCAAGLINAQSSCGNLDFENQNYNGWNLYSGSNQMSNSSPVNVTAYTGASTSGANSANPVHALVTSNNSQHGVSLSSGIPGSTIVARLNHMNAGAMAAILERTMTVTSNQPLINFSYLFFSQGSGHSTTDQPYLHIAVYDQSNLVIPTSTMLIVAQNANVMTPGFTTTPANTGWFYKPWTPVTLNLTQYIGQTVTLKITATDCTAGGHSGYAYVDFDCGGATANVPHVWPGDANYDLTVDFLDLFYVGAGNGLNGTARTTPGTTWAAATSNNWYQNTLYLVDAKHADCDGSGTVNNTDLGAINTNYGSTHPFKLIKPEVLYLKSSANVPLTIVPNKTSVTTNESLTLDFMIGSSSIPVDSIFAIGFNLQYPDNLFDSPQTVFDCSSSIVGNISTNLWSLRHDHSGSVDLAIARNDHQNVKNIVNGKIFSLNLNTKTSASPATMNFVVSNAVALDRSGKQINITGAPATVQLVMSNPVGLKEVPLTQVSIGPNPVRDELNYHLSAGETGLYTIQSVDGRLISKGEIDPAAGTIKTAGLKTGVYLLRFELSNGQTITKKFLKEQEN